MQPPEGLVAAEVRTVGELAPKVTMNYQDFYRDNARDYDALVAAEDAAGHLRRALLAALPPPPACVLEVGAGTGRITRWLVAHGHEVLATDAEAGMLAVARQHLPNTRLVVAPAHALPAPDASMDAAVAGWVFGHQTRWADDWRVAIGHALAEMHRVVRPGGVLAIMETLGTGRETPLAPDPALAAYYAWLESEHGFARQALRTDYEFADAATAHRVLRPFFGEKLSITGPVVAECTGLWCKTTAA